MGSPKGGGPKGGGPEGWGPEGWGPEGWGPEGWGPEGWGPEGARRVGARRVGARRVGARRVGARRVGPNPEKVEARRVGARRVGGPKFRFFFPLPPQNSFFSSLSGGPSPGRGILVVFMNSAPGRSPSSNSARLEFLAGCPVKTTQTATRSRRGFTRTHPRAQTCTFDGSTHQALQPTIHQNSTRRPPRGVPMGRRERIRPCGFTTLANLEFREKKSETFWAGPGGCGRCGPVGRASGPGDVGAEMPSREGRSRRRTGSQEGRF